MLHRRSYTRYAQLARRLAAIRIGFVLLVLLSSFQPSVAQPDALLMSAIRNNDLGELRKRLQHPVDLAAVDGCGANALMWAVFYSDLPVIRELVIHGAKPPKGGYIEDKETSST